VVFRRGGGFDFSFRLWRVGHHSLAGGAVFGVRVEFLAAALFAYFVNGADFSSSLRVTPDTEDNPTKITDVNSRATFFT
jgi:hypothetical protein